MFGYVIADLARLDEGQQTRYKSFYCGLCRARLLRRFVERGQKQRQKRHIIG